MSKLAPYTKDDCSEKMCTKCNRPLSIGQFYTTGKKVSGAPKYNSWCKDCIGEKQATYHLNTWGPDKLQRSAFTRTKSVRSYLNYLRSKAISRNAKGVDTKDVISSDALEILWNLQSGKCALTGWDMTMELGQGVVSTNCSIDRINSNYGYIVGNIQLVCRAANIAKHDLSSNDFLLLCNSVVKVRNGC